MGKKLESCMVRFGPAPGSLKKRPIVAKGVAYGKIEISMWRIIMDKDMESSET